MSEWPKKCSFKNLNNSVSSVGWPLLDNKELGPCPTSRLDHANGWDGFSFADLSTAKNESLAQQGQLLNLAPAPWGQP